MLDDLQREMERYLTHFNRASKRPTIVFTQHSHSGPVWTPALDVYETADALVIVLELAGIDSTRTEIHAEAGLVRIRGARQMRNQPGPGEHRTYHALEVAYGPFERTVPIPAGVDPSQAKAAYRDGLLEVTIPKRTRHQVRISVETEGQP